MKKFVVGALLLAPVVAGAGCSGNSQSNTGSGGHSASAGGGSGTAGAGGSAGKSAGGTSGAAGSAGGVRGTAGGAGGAAGGAGGAAGSAAGAAGGAGGASRPATLAQLCGTASVGGGGQAGGSAGGSAGGAAGAGLTVSPLAFVNQTYVGDPRVTPSEAIFSFINSTDDPHLQTLRLHNGGTAAIAITGLHLVDNGPAGGTLFPPTYNQVSLPDAFKVTTDWTFPGRLEAGADLDVTVQFLSTRTNPPDRMLNIGGQAASAILVAQTSAGCATAGLYGVSLWNNSETPPDAVTGLPSNNWARYEPTFGQIVATLGYKVNLGSQFIQLLNTNDMSIPNVGSSTEEIQVHKFVKADTSAPVQLLSVGRFSPPTDCPFGWYVAGSLTGAGTSAAGGAGGGAGNLGGAGGGAGSTGAAIATITDAQPGAIQTGLTLDGTKPAPLQIVATMVSSPLGVDWNRSNYSDMLLPPLKDGSSATFDPGAATVFGIWAFTNQRSVGGVTSAGVPAPNPGNGDYVYSEDTLNLDATHSHRLRVYPLKDRAGVLVAHSYLLGWEEATNGDYQDYVFLLKNANPAP